MHHKEPVDCKCGHSWEDHHHGSILNTQVLMENHTQGICGGVMAEECEATQVNGKWTVKEEDICHCEQYEKP